MTEPDKTASDWGVVIANLTIYIRPLVGSGTRNTGCIHTLDLRAVHIGARLHWPSGKSLALDVSEGKPSRMDQNPTPLRTESAVITFVDVVESVRLVETYGLESICKIRDLISRVAQEIVPSHGGQVLERRGDGLVLRFPSARRAIGAAKRMHELCRLAASLESAEEPLRLRAGLHRCEFVQDDSGVYGAGINLAARIAALGRPGDTLMSAAARDELFSPIDGTLEDLGDCFLKHVDAPVRVFRLVGQRADLPVELEHAIDARMRIHPALVVLPFFDEKEAAGTSPGLGTLVSDQLTRRFSRSSVLHVISSYSAQAMSRPETSLRDIYSVLRVNFVLRGKLLVQPVDGQHGRVSVFCELWRKGSPEPIWAETIDSQVNDLLSTEGDIVSRICEATSHHILRVEMQAVAASRELPSLASHTKYLAAIGLLHRFSGAQFERARELLVDLTELAPRHAAPFAWLARWHVFRVVQGWSENRQVDSQRAAHYCERALDRDPCSALALTMAGSVRAGVNGDAAGAQELYDAALAHNPNDSLAWLMSSVARGFLNEGNAALAASETALGLAPVEPHRDFYDALAATAALRAGELERCIALADRAILGNRSHGSAYRSKAIALAQLGRDGEGADVVRRLLTVEPHFTVQTYLARVPTQDARSQQFAQDLERLGLPHG